MVRMCINALQNRSGGQCDWMGMVLCKGFPKWKKAIGFTVVNCFNGYLTLRVYSLKGLKPVSLLVGGGQRRVWRAAGAVKGHGCCCGA